MSKTRFSKILNFRLNRKSFLSNMRFLDTETIITCCFYNQQVIRHLASFPSSFCIQAYELLQTVVEYMLEIKKQLWIPGSCPLAIKLIEIHIETKLKTKLPTNHMICGLADECSQSHIILFCVSIGKTEILNRKRQKLNLRNIFQSLKQTLTKLKMKLKTNLLLTGQAVYFYSNNQQNKR